MLWEEEVTGSAPPSLLSFPLNHHIQALKLIMRPTVLFPFTSFFLASAMGHTKHLRSRSEPNQESRQTSDSDSRELAESFTKPISFIGRDSATPLSWCEGDCGMSLVKNGNPMGHVHGE